ncbi:carboxymuconolactone decarboxylase family protein [Pseudonocardia zijingensis]|uniref:carboxymuconolactone decarboxylase family protein n=1 Tax=Pseudonocardia zijingensis TaxID=153376 RepID=UPI0031DAD97A
MDHDDDDGGVTVGERLRTTPEEMTPDQLEVYTAFREGPALAVPHPPGGGLAGPPATWVLSPPLARVFRSAARALRFELQLSDRSREIALLLHAFHRDSAFEIHAHRRAGRAAGLAEEEIEGLATRSAPAFRSEEERAVFTVTLALLDRQTLDDGEYADAVGVLGEQTLFELVSLVGFYDLVATQLAVFEVEPPVNEMGERDG